MTQAEALTPSLTGGMALFTLIGYMAVYAAVFFWSGIYYLLRVVRQGMLPHDQEMVAMTRTCACQAPAFRCRSLRLMTPQPSGAGANPWKPIRYHIDLGRRSSVSG